MNNQSKALSATLVGAVAFQMGSADPLVANVIGDIKQRSLPPCSLFSALPRGFFKYVPLDVVLTSAEHRAVIAFFDGEAAANGT
jgi:hypothetical protein